MQVDRGPGRSRRPRRSRSSGFSSSSWCSFRSCSAGTWGRSTRTTGASFSGLCSRSARRCSTAGRSFGTRCAMGARPYWALPNTAPVYPPLVIALLLRGPIGATNLVLIAHLLAGAWGTRALAREVGVGRFAAFLAAAAFLYAPLTRLYGLNQPWATMAMAFLPMDGCTRSCAVRTVPIGAYAASSRAYSTRRLRGAAGMSSSCPVSS